MGLATSTIEQVQQNYYIGFLLFVLTFFAVIVLYRKK